MQGFVTRTITNSSKKKTEKDLKTTKSFETKIATSMAHWLLSRPKEVTVEKPNPDRMKEMNKTQAAVSAVATISTNAAPKAGSDTPLTKSGSQGKEDSKSSKASKSKDVSSIGGSQVMNKEGTGKVVKTLSTSTKPVSTKGPQPKQLIPQFNSITDQSSILEHLDLQGFLYQKVLTLWTCYVCRAALNHVASYRRHTASPGHQRKMSQLQRPEGIIERQKIALDLRKLPFQNAISLDKLSTGNVSRMYFCSACGEGFTCASEEHKKNERHLTLNASRLHCDLCNLYYQNKKCLIKHQNGKLHITMKEIRKEAIQAKCKEAHKEIIPKVHETRQYKATMASKIPAVKTTDRAVLDNKGSKDDRGSLVVTLQAKSVPIASDPIDVSNKDTTGDEDENIIGLDLVIPVSGFFCRCCSKFYNSKHMAKRNHCRTAAHKEKALLWYKSHGITKTVKKYAASNEDENKNPPHGQSAQGPIIVIDDDDDDDDEDAGGDGEENQSKEEQTQSGNKHEGSECPQEQEKMQTGDVPVSGGDTTSHDQTGNDMTEVQIQTRLYDATSASNLVSTKNDEEEKSVFAPPDQEGEPSTNEAEHDARSSIDVEKLESNGSSQQGLELDEDMQSKGEGFLAEKQECPTKGKETWDGQHPPAEGDDLLSAEEELNAKRAQITASRENIDLEEGEILSEGELSTEQQNPPPCKEMMIVATDKPEVGNQELWTKEMEVGSGGENLPCCGSEMGADQVEEAEKPAAGNKDTDWLDDDLYGDLDEQLHEEENDEENSEAEEEPQRDGDEEMEDDEEAKFFIDEGMWEVRSEEGDSDA